MFRIGKARFDRAAQALYAADGRLIGLRAQSVRVLDCLLATNGQLVSKDTLMSAVWGQTVVSDDSLIQCVKEIRAAVGDTDRTVLQTVLRRGYRLHAELDDSATVAGLVKRTENGAGSGFGARLDDPAAQASNDETNAQAQVQASDQAKGPLGDRRNGLTSSAGRVAGIATAATSKGLPPAVAVLPGLIGHGADPTSGVTSRFAAQLARELARNQGVQVIPSTRSAAVLAQYPRDTRLAERLGARFLLHGEVRYEAGWLLGSLELVDATRDTIVLTEHIREGAATVAAAIEARAAMLGVSVSARIREYQRREILERTEIDLSDPAELKLRINALEQRAQISSQREANRLAAIAMERFPDDADVWSVAARAHLMDMELQLTGEWTAERGEQIKDQAQRAIVLNRSLASAYAALARALCTVGEFDAAPAVSAQAIALSPNELSWRNFRSTVLFFCGQLDESIEVATSTLQHAPVRYTYFMGNLGRTLYVHRGDPKAIDLLREAVALRPTATQARITLVLAHHEHGEFSEARAHCRELMANTTGFSLRYFGRRWDRIDAIRQRYRTALAAYGVPQEPG